MYVKDGDHPRHHKGSHNFRKSGRKKAIYAGALLNFNQGYLHSQRGNDPIEGRDCRYGLPMLYFGDIGFVGTDAICQFRLRNARFFTGFAKDLGIVFFPGPGFLFFPGIRAYRAEPVNKMCGYIEEVIIVFFLHRITANIDKVVLLYNNLVVAIARVFAKEHTFFETPAAKKQFMQEESRVKGHLLAFWKTEDCEVQRG